MELEKHPTALVILDGFGHRSEKNYNAIAQARTPHMRHWTEQYPYALIDAAGNAVGLTEHAIGNSEVGHLTIGAGRIITQPMVLLNDAIEQHQLEHNEALIHALKTLASLQKPLHIIGLLSDGGVHSHIQHLFAFIAIAQTYGLTVYVHAILDGRDTPPRSAATYLDALISFINDFPQVQLATLCGRFYAMDRDNNWDRTARYYALLTETHDAREKSWEAVIQEYYAQDITDEFIPPTHLRPDATVQDGHGILFYNVRPDRARQLTQAFVDEAFHHFLRHAIKLSCFITPVSYGHHIPTTALMEQEAITHTLKEILDGHRKTIFSIAESEKQAQITYFFDGLREQLFAHETRIIVPSITTDSFKQYPEMSAPTITQNLVHSMQTLPQDFYVINYANADMVGHSGDLPSTIRAIECLDEQLRLLYEQLVMRMKGTLYITADHGKAEDLYNPHNHQPYTAHTGNKVPFFMIRHDLKNKPTTMPVTQLGDIAPFILKNMKLPVPEIMHQI